jgi:hypothetical protein
LQAAGGHLGTNCRRLAAKRQTNGGRLAAAVACYLHVTGCRISILKINSSNDYIVKNCITVSKVILKRIGFHGDMINKERNYSPQRILQMSEHTINFLMFNLWYIIILFQTLYVTIKRRYVQSFSVFCRLVCVGFKAIKTAFFGKIQYIHYKNVKFNAFLNPLKKCQKIMGKSYQ